MNKRVRTVKKLTVNRETLRRISAEELQNAAGGTCWSVGTDCVNICQDNQDPSISGTYC